MTPFLQVSLPEYNIFIGFTSGPAPADLLAVNIAAEPIVSVLGHRQVFLWIKEGIELVTALQHMTSQTL